LMLGFMVLRLLVGRGDGAWGMGGGNAGKGGGGRWGRRLLKVGGGGIGIDGDDGVVRYLVGRKGVSGRGLGCLLLWCHGFWGSEGGGFGWTWGFGVG